MENKIVNRCHGGRSGNGVSSFSCARLHVSRSRDKMMSDVEDVEADTDAAGGYPQNATGPLFGSTVDLI